MKQVWQGPLERLDACRVRLPKEHKPGMRVDGIVYVNDALLELVRQDQAMEQVANVAFLPGIVGASLAMPDIHWGYGFPIGGVAATDPEQGGVVSPGGVGYDINCGVRLVRTNLDRAGVAPRIQELVGALFRDIPCGVGRGGALRFSRNEQKGILETGAQWLVEKGYGRPSDLARTESNGRLERARPGAVSDRALERGQDQVGTLGSGNHFVEVQYVEKIFDAEAARAFGVEKDQVLLMIHSGSRGLGHEVCSDAIRALQSAPAKYGIELPDRQLVCAPVHAPEGQRYLGAMRCAANFAWANRQGLLHLARKTFAHFFKMSDEQLGMEMIYDVAHNIAKMEHHLVGGEERLLCVHRKGATRAFPAGHPDVPEEFRAVGQPVLIPGDMGRCSYLLVGKQEAMKATFGSACHGAGRVMSRKQAVQSARGRSIRKELRERGVVALARGRHGLDEEQPDAYKDVSQVVDVVDRAGLAGKVCRIRPMGVIKG